MTAFLFALFVLAPAPQPVKFHAVADWELSQLDHDWLEKWYLPARFEEARQIIALVNGQTAPTMAGFTLQVHLHPDLFPDRSTGTLVAGQSQIPTLLDTIDIDIDWQFETEKRLAVSHEFCHVLQLYSGFAGWMDIGHGTPYDPALNKILSFADRVYVPGHAYDPFKTTVY
jgi:hypothetical protein